MKKRKRYIVRDEVIAEIIANVEKMKKQKLKPMSIRELGKLCGVNKNVSKD